MILVVMSVTSEVAKKVWKIQGVNGTRNPDISDASVVLNQLSYGGQLEASCYVDQW